MYIHMFRTYIIQFKRFFKLCELNNKLTTVPISGHAYMYMYIIMYCTCT